MTHRIVAFVPKKEYNDFLISRLCNACRRHKIDLHKARIDVYFPETKLDQAMTGSRLADFGKKWKYPSAFFYPGGIESFDTGNGGLLPPPQIREHREEYYGAKRVKDVIKI